jgi:hypothetical protein
VWGFKSLYPQSFLSTCCGATQGECNGWAAGAAFDALEFSETGMAVPVCETSFEIEGTLQPNGKLILDEKPTMPPGRVHAALQAIANGTDPDVLTVLQSIRAAQSARGHASRTREEIDADIDAMRGEDESSVTAILPPQCP